MVVICPKCKVKLKVADEKIAPEGTRFKCPKCGTVLLVKRPVAHAHVRFLNKGKILVAHEDAAAIVKIRSILTASGYEVIPVGDGIAAMVRATKELPFAAILSVSIPKIFGFEVCRKLKTLPETKDMKIVLMASIYDMKKYRRDPESLHDADDYIEEHQIDELLIEKINALKKGTGTGRQETPREPVKSSAATEALKKETVEGSVTQPLPERKTAAAGDPAERARRLARTIISDIYLYGKARVDDSIMNNTFHRTFAAELKEGLKLYESRISMEVRGQGDFFNEAINNFIKKRKEEISRYS